MKKLLLSALCACGLAVSAGAVNVTDVLTNSTFGIGTVTTYATYADKAATSAARYTAVAAGTDGTIQIRYNTAAAKASGVFTTVSGGKAVSAAIKVNHIDANQPRTIYIYGKSTAYAAATDLMGTDVTDEMRGTKIGEATFETDKLTAEFTFDTQYEYIAIASSYGAIYIDEIDVTWDAESAPAQQASKPVITLDADNKVTITAEGADAIYYTIDGTEPTTASTLYSAPFAISATTTVKAVAVKAGMENSDIATAELTPSTGYANFAALIAANPAKTDVITVNGPITIIYNNGSNTYVKDKDGGYMLLYSTAKLIKDVNNGDVLASVTGSYSPFSNLPEIVPSAIGEITTGGAAVQPEETAIEEIGQGQENKYIKIAGVSITKTSTNNTYTFTDETGEIVGYNTFYNSNYYTVVEVPEGDNFTVTGFVGRRNDTMQITPIAFEGGQTIERCENPVFSVASGSVEKGTQVEITCATEGASIFYTVDGSEPGASATEYTGAIAINESMTIKAIAIKEGNNNSEVVSASYTVLADGVTVAQFDFTKPGTLNPAQSATEITEVSDIIFKDKDVSISFVAGKTAHKLYYGTTNGASTIDLRLYVGTDEKASTMTIEAANAKSIDKIELTKLSGNFAMTPDSGTLADGVWTPGETAASKVVFTVTATTRIATMNVVYTAGENSVSSVAVDNANAPVEYYNLQGVRVNNPTTGLYIVKQGNKVSKQLIR
jgi:uncharacterized protein YdeI (BOF family)